MSNKGTNDGMINEAYYGPGGPKKLSPELIELFKNESIYGPGGMKELSPKMKDYLKNEIYNPCRD